MTGLAPKLGLAAGSLAFALLGVEVSLRIAGYDPRSASLDGRVRLARAAPRPERGYELVPGASGNGWGTWVEVNSLGFRGPEPSPEEDGRARIVALGDSVTFGNDLAFEETWPARLQRALCDAGRPTDVLNLALGGYDTVQEVATLEDLGLAFSPEQVIVGYCVNDVGIVTMTMEPPFVEADRANPLYHSRIAQWLHTKQVDRAARRALYEQNREAEYSRRFAAEILALEDGPLLERVLSLRRSVLDAPSAERDLATRRIPPRWYASEARIGRLKFAFERLARLGREHGFTVTVLLIPYLVEDPRIAEGYEIVRELAQGFGFAVVDPGPAFRARGLEGLRIREEDPVHPNAAGHELMTEALLASPVFEKPASASPPE